MAEGSKSKPRRARKPKGGPSSVAPVKQRTLKDMFGITKGSMQEDVPVEDVRESVVVELSDTEPEQDTRPSSQTGKESKPVSRASSVGSLNGNNGLPSLALQPPKPKKLFPIFNPPKSRGSVEARTHANGNTTMKLPTSFDDLQSNTPQPGPSTLPAPARSRSPSVVLVSEPMPQDLREGLSRDAPIVIETTPAPEPPPAPSKPVYSIFARQPRSGEKSSAKIPEGVPAPYPEQHMQEVHDYSSFPVPSPAFPLRSRGKVECSAIDTAQYPVPWTHAPIISGEISEGDITVALHPYHEVDVASCISTIPRSHQSCPAVSRILQAAEEPTQESSEHVSHEQWIDKWRPRRAIEVLGNEHHAQYLRDWLKALRLQAETMRPTEAKSAKRPNKKRKVGKSKKPDVVRHVKKRRGANSQEFLDDFLAADDFEEDEYDYTTQSSDWDDLIFCQDQNDRINGAGPSEPGSQRSSPPLDIFEEWATRPYQTPRFGRQISNTILLCGPSGSGKTAAVHACAQELGWEVFEVYPGIGDRSGADLNRLIGDVGSNHTVKVHQSPKKSVNKVDFFRGAADSKVKPMRNPRRILDSDDEQVDELDVISLATESSPDFPPLTLPPEPDLEPVVNQSVILIEEADILYQTDTNFWPALINIIKNSRRPVVLTCNDPTLIPCQDLPLQTTLFFEPCPTPLATSYMQALTLTEGQPVVTDDLVRVYETFSQDLRRSIQHLQLWNRDGPERVSNEEATIGISSASSPLTSLSDDATPPPNDSAEPDTDRVRREDARAMFEMDKQCSALSLVDCWRPVNVLGNYFLDEPGPSTDDELGYRVLHSGFDYDHVPVNPLYSYGEAIFTAAIRNLEGLGYGDVTLLSDHALEERAQRYLTRVGPILRSFRSWHTPATDPALHVDYAPWIRAIISTEDERAAALLLLEGGSQRRRTRNSQRAETQNWLSLNAFEREALTSTTLSP